LRLPDFKISTNKGIRFFSRYIPAAFVSHEIFLVFISVKDLVGPRVIVRPDG